MKSLMVLVALFPVVAMATKPTPPPKDPAQQQAQAQSQGQKQGQAQGQQQAQELLNTNRNDSTSYSASGSDNDISVEFAAAKTRHNTPGVSLGGIFPSAVCMGVINGGVSAPGFGIGAGKSYVDEECDKRETARSFAALGYTREALVILCSTKAAQVLEECGLQVPVAPVTCPERQCPDPVKVIEQKKQVIEASG